MRGLISMLDGVLRLPWLLMAAFAVGRARIGANGSQAGASVDHARSGATLERDVTELGWRSFAHRGAMGRRHVRNDQ